MATFLFPWTPDEDATLRQCWAEGGSSVEARKLLPNRSKNAILGRVHRLGLSAKQQARREGRESPRNRDDRKRHARQIERRVDWESLRVLRDPCPKCNVRADIGCRHQRVA